MKDFDDFERDFERTKKLGLVAGIISLAISLGLMGFGIWVILLLLRHFGVL